MPTFTRFVERPLLALLPEQERPALARFAVAVLSVAAATLARWPLQEQLGPSVPFLLYFPAVIVAGWFGGLGPALLATGLSGVAAQFFLMEPFLSFRLVSRAEWLRLSLFAGIGIFISLLIEELHRSRRRVQAAALERLLHQQELQRASVESEERFRIMADSAPVFVWMSGADRLCDWFNRPWLEYRGRTLEQEIGHGWEEGIHPDDLGGCWDAFYDVYEARREFSVEYRLRRHDGEYRWMLTRGVPRTGSDGEHAGYIGSVIDIHDRRRAEQERLQLLDEMRQAWKEAEAASRSKDEFLATVSHELRTPLNAILGWAQILELTPDDKEKRARGLQAIHRNAKAQAQLIDDLLDLSRIVSGKMRLDVRTVDLVPVLEAAIDAVRPAAEARQIRLQRVLDPLAGPVTGDADRLRQVVWNLLSNAVKFTPRGGRVELRLERVSSHVEIVVADSGVGISPEFQPHVFDRFRQFDASAARSHGGLGLGLAIVRHLVELHGGTVAVRSPGPDQGSTFVVTLPLSIARLDAPDRRVHPHAAEETAAACREDPALNLRGIRVLIVDDEPDARETLLEILEHCDAEVLAVGSADEALRELERFKPHVLLSDIGMPGEDGYALIRRVRELPPERGGRVPAAALTAFARGEDRRRALLAGFQMHVPKPVEVNELATVVATLARGSAPGVDTSTVSAERPPSPPG
jgi:PAS domain S-box-containing protein